MSQPTKITLIGSGTIGLSFAALHLTANPTCLVRILDTRADLQDYVSKNLPGYLTSGDQESCISRLSFAQDIADAVHDADVVQEQGPESTSFKVSIWGQIEAHAPPHALFWSSTSGIPASEQSRNMRDRSRLVVVHPYNPPHIMPLLEVVRSAETANEVVERTLKYWRDLGRTPVVVKKECTGFVANRLAFALLREASSLVSQGIVDVQDLDDIVSASMGPRWAVAGPFKSYHAGGGEGGLSSFIEKIGETIQNCWDASEEDVRKGGIRVGGEWQRDVCRQAEEAYGVVDTYERDHKTRQVLEAVKR